MAFAASCSGASTFTYTFSFRGWNRTVRMPWFRTARKSRLHGIMSTAILQPKARFLATYGRRQLS